jgi:hypothetical protein
MLSPNKPCCPPAYIIHELIVDEEGEVTPAEPDFLLLESGDYLLLETGDKIILE